MNSSRIKWVALVFIISLSISLIIHTPVNQLFRLVALPDNVQVHNLSGSITGATIGYLGYQGYFLTDVRVNFSPSCLLTLAICYSIKTDDYDLNALTSFNPLNQSFSLLNSRATLESQFFDQFSQMLVKPKGEFLVTVDNISFQSQKLTDISIQINWLNAGIEGEDQLLGDYLVKIYTEKDILKMVLGDEESLLSAKGNMDVFPNGAYVTDVNLESKAGLKPSIKNALTMFAKPAGLGKYRYSNKGQLSNKNKRILQFIDMSNSEG